MPKRKEDKKYSINITKRGMFLEAVICAVFLSGVLYFVLMPRNIQSVLEQNSNVKIDGQTENADLSKTETLPSNKLENPPEEVKALYLTGWSAGNTGKMDGIIELIGKEKLNAVVIDIKDYSGYVSYETGIEEIEKYKAEQIMIKDVNSLIKKLHEKKIYVIARITVFQDPILAKARPDLAVKNKATGGVWRDNKGLAWIDPAAKDAWDYIVKIAKNASEKGFDEINFDYIRFPSDGSLGNMSFPFYKKEEKEKHEVIRDFFSYLSGQLSDEKISADLFGLATINKDDLGIGQIIEDAYGNFDFVCPMTYPSHYANGFQGFANPASYPYEVVKYSIAKAKTKLDEFNAIEGSENLKRKAKLRPWLQAFDMGGTYGPERVKAQIRASDESGGVGWILWNSSNNYASRIKGIID